MAYTSAQLVTLAGQICDVPGRTTQIGQLLNIILQDYAQTMDLDIIFKTTTINFLPSISSYTLPSDYLRYKELFYSVNGTIFYMNQIPLEEYDQQFQGSGINNFPQSFATDMSQSPPLLLPWPPPDTVQAATLRYRPQRADISIPESSTDIPWFPNQRVLLKDLCAETMQLSDDARKAGFDADVEKRMRKYLVMDDDKEGFAQQVKLDRRTFRPRANLPPDKIYGF